MYYLMPYIYGCNTGFGSVHLLFRSRPIIHDLELPIMTPSGFIIGTNFII
jgi:hypothetical protein